MIWIGFMEWRVLDWRSARDEKKRFWEEWGNRSTVTVWLENKVGSMLGSQPDETAGVG